MFGQIKLYLRFLFCDVYEFSFQFQHWLSQVFGRFLNITYAMQLHERGDWSLNLTPFCTRSKVSLISQACLKYKAIIILVLYYFVFDVIEENKIGLFQTTKTGFCFTIAKQQLTKLPNKPAPSLNWHIWNKTIGLFNSDHSYLSFGTRKGSQRVGKVLTKNGQSCS